MLTQDDLDKLESALARGSKRVTFSDGRSVEYNSFEEMTRRINYVRQSLGKQAAETRHLAKFSKGVQS